MTPKDLFSTHAADYAAFRPDYPAALYQFIFDHVSNFHLAWDCATGNGQAAKMLATKFEKVLATDISEKQMHNGVAAPNIIYSVSPAESTIFPDRHFDLITVAQAAHWFKLPAFYQEVKRVCKPGGVVAIWGYGLLSINENFDDRLTGFYRDVVGPFWDPERRLIDEAYQTIDFPFEEIKAPMFYMEKQWNIQQLAGYLSTWSAVQKFVLANGYNPVENFMNSVIQYLPENEFKIQFPLFARIGWVR